MNTHVAPTTNISTVLARATADNAAIKTIVAVTITERRTNMLLEDMHIMLGVKRSTVVTEAIMARAAIVIEDPEKMWTLGSAVIL